MNRYITLTILVISVLLVALACEREIESKDPLRSVPEDCPRVISLSSALGDESASIFWELTDSSKVQRFRVYVAEGTDTVFTVWDSTSDFSYTFTSLTANRVYSVSVAPVRSTGLECDRSESVTLVVSPLSILIEDDDQFTNSRNVSIRVNTAANVTDIKLYEAPDSASAVWKPLTGTQTSFRLSDGDGLKTVYAELLFADGGRTADHLSDQITLDRTAEISSVSFAPTDSLFHPGDMITFSLDAGESDGSASVDFSGVSRVDLYEGTTPGVYTRQWTVPTGFSLASDQVTGSFTDAAGNRAVEVVAPEVLRIAASLDPVVVTVTVLSSYEVSLSWSQASTGEFLSYRIYRDTLSTVSSSSTLIAAISNRSTTSFLDDDLDENTTYYYRVYVYDTFGQVASSGVVEATTQANVPPGPIELTAVPDEDAERVQLVWDKSGAVDFASYRVYRSNNSTVTTDSKLVELINNSNSTGGTYDAPTGTTYWRVFVFDKQGAATGSNTVSVNIP
ncbi:hypothetical protein GF356_10070 [candidate division GN15 bacterium]|nr:hypothetical protein [candidate division GN15 bacterium]